MVLICFNNRKCKKCKKKCKKSVKNIGKCVKSYIKV